LNDGHPGVFKSRVGKRVLLLLLITALVPLGVLALLSLSQVRQLLLEQASTRLASMAKGYATGVYERLLAARDNAILLAEQPVIPSPVSHSISKPFSYLGRTTIGGDLVTITGAISPEMRTAVAAYLRSPLQSVTLLRHLSNGKLVLFQRASGATGDTLVAELDSDYIWGDEDDRKADMIICVVERISFDSLYCPHGEEMNLPDVLRNAEKGSTLSDITWTKGGMVYRGRIWAQFLTNDFASPDWYFALSIPEDDVLAAVYAFRRFFIPVVLLALLLISWLSMRQVRAMLVPLAKLSLATKRLAANDFGTPVEVESNDEFGELGEAFNSMSLRLGRQFLVSRAHGEIDRLILERTQLDRIVESALGHAGKLLPDVVLTAVLLDGSEVDRGHVFRLVADGGEKSPRLMMDAVALPRATWPDLASPASVSFVHVESMPAWRRLAGPATHDHEWVQPLTWGKSVCGWLSCGKNADAAFNEEEKRTITELGGRLAVAVASAWREDELFNRAHYDSLTGLPNRSLFSDRLQHEIARCRREARMLAVMFVDLDHFKSINDSEGHGAGDVLLCEAAMRISGAVRESDTVSRYGGDEFTVLLTDFHEQGDVLRVSRHIIDALSASYSVAGHECFLSATIGIAIFPGNGESAEDLLKHADTAMYRGKEAGRGQALFFEERMNADAIARLAIDRELRHAIERGEFVLHYQPQVSLALNTCVSAEALVRWNHPERGLLAPVEFIAIAEDAGLIGAIGRWVLDESCRQLIEWRRDGLVLERLSVNVSAKQFREDGFVDYIHRTVVDAGLATSIEFEITETVLLERTDLLEEKLKQIAEAGYTIALDDFGTGFSSLAYLKKLPVHVVKIDRVFVEDIERSADSRAFTEAMILMAHALDKHVIAEGAEQIAQIEILHRLGCDMVQGYYFSRPLPAEQFAAFVRGFGHAPTPWLNAAADPASAAGVARFRMK